MKKYIQSDTVADSIISVDLNTGVLPVVSVDTYSRQDLFYEFEEEIPDSEIDPEIMRIATPYIQDTVDTILPSARITPIKMWHPKAYNFAVDELDFTLSVSTSEFEALKEKALSDNSFATFLRKNYSSYDGFWSNMASDIQEFNEQEDWKQIVQVIMFYIPYEQIQRNNRDFTEDLWYYLSENYTLADDMNDEEM